MFQQSLQLREQFRIYTQFPFKDKPERFFHQSIAKIRYIVPSTKHQLQSNRYYNNQEFELYNQNEITNELFWHHFRLNITKISAYV